VLYAPSVELVAARDRIVDLTAFDSGGKKSGEVQLP
jgi:hypothetical protein